MLATLAVALLGARLAVAQSGDSAPLRCSGWALIGYGQTEDEFREQGKVYANQICSGQVPPAEPLDEAIAAAAVSTGLVCTGGDGDSGFARATLTAKSFKDKLAALGEGFALADACTECFESDACKSCAKVQVQVTLEGLLAMSQSEVVIGTGDYVYDGTLAGNEELANGIKEVLKGGLGGKPANSVLPKGIETCSLEAGGAGGDGGVAAGGGGTSGGDDGNGGDDGSGGDAGSGDGFGGIPDDPLPKRLPPGCRVQVAIDMKCARKSRGLTLLRSSVRSCRGYPAVKCVWTGQRAAKCKPAVPKYQSKKVFEGCDQP